MHLASFLPVVLPRPPPRPAHACRYTKRTSGTGGKDNAWGERGKPRTYRRTQDERKSETGRRETRRRAERRDRRFAKARPSAGGFLPDSFVHPFAFRSVSPSVRIRRSRTRRRSRKDEKRDRSKEDRVDSARQLRPIESAIK